MIFKLKVYHKEFINLNLMQQPTFSFKKNNNKCFDLGIRFNNNLRKLNYIQI